MYQNREQFLGEVTLLHTNSLSYNGLSSYFFYC